MNNIHFITYIDQLLSKYYTLMLSRKCYRSSLSIHILFGLGFKNDLHIHNVKQMLNYCGILSPFFDRTKNWILSNAIQWDLNNEHL